MTIRSLSFVEAELVLRHIRIAWFFLHFRIHARNGYRHGVSADLP